MFTAYYKLLPLLILSTLILPTQANKSYIYESGYLTDIQVHQGYTMRAGPISGSGYTYDIFYPQVVSNGITYVGKTESSLLDWTVGQPVEIRFNKNKTSMYLKREKGKDLRINIIKKVSR